MSDDFRNASTPSHRASLRALRSCATRRDVLRHAGHAALLLPLLRAFEGTGYGATTAPAGRSPSRVIFVFTPNGPELVSGTASGTETNFVVQEFWKKLERHRARGIFMSHMKHGGLISGEKHNEYGHQSAGTAALTATTTEGTNSATGPSINFFLGDALQKAGQVSPFPSLLWGLHDSAGNWGPWFETAGKHVAPTRDVFSVFETLGGRIRATNSADEASTFKLDARHSALNEAYADCRALLPSLGAEGRVFLDRHCSNIESQVKGIEKSLEGVALQCEQPTLKGGLASGANLGDRNLRDKLSDAFIDLMGVALSCELTRVIGFGMDGPSGRFQIPSSYGVKPSPPLAQGSDSGDGGQDAHHAWTHTPVGAPEKYENLRQFYDWYSERVARMLDMLTTRLDGAGRPLMDSTLVVWVSELGGWNGGGPQHANDNIPVVLFGDSQGAFKTGRYYKGTNNPADMQQLWVSVAHHMGLADVTRFGNPRGTSGPFAWLKG